MRKAGRGLNRRGNLESMWGPSSVSPITVELRQCCAQRKDVMLLRDAEMDEGKDALAAGGRRAREELRSTEPHNCTPFSQRRRGPEQHQHNNCRSRLNRRCRVHHNAQRTLIGIAVERMDMRYLNRGQQHQQGKAQQGRSAKRARRQPPFPDEMCPEPFHANIPLIKGYTG